MIARLTIATLLVGATFGATVDAQECRCGAPLIAPKWSVYASTGAGLLEVASTNGHLGAASLPSVSDDAMGFGVGGFYVFGPLRLGAEQVWLDAGRESTAAGLSSRLGSSHTMVSLGVELFEYSRVKIVPTFGVGRAVQVLVVGDNAGGATPPASPPPTFDDVLNAPGTSSRLTGTQWIWEPMIAADALVRTSRDANWGITLGVRAGYRIAPNRPAWSYKGREALGGPVDQANGPILQLIVGFGHR